MRSSSLLEASGISPQDMLVYAGEEDPCFEFASGVHARCKVEATPVLQNEAKRARISHAMARLIHGMLRFRPDAVIGIATGANQLAIDIADILATDKQPVAGVVTAKLPNGDIVVPSKELLVVMGVQSFIYVDDVLTKGSTVRRALRDMTMLPSRNQPKAKGIFICWDRGGPASIGRVPVFAMHRQPIPSWKPDECPYAHTHRSDDLQGTIV